MTYGRMSLNYLVKQLGDNSIVSKLKKCGIEDKDRDEAEFDFDDLDPTNTEFNSLVRPEDRQPITFGQSSSTHPHDAVMGSSASSSLRPGPSTTFGPLFRFPGNPSPVSLP